MELANTNCDKAWNAPDLSSLFTSPSDKGERRDGRGCPDLRHPTAVSWRPFVDRR